MKNIERETANLTAKADQKRSCLFLIKGAATWSSEDTVLRHTYTHTHTHAYTYMRAHTHTHFMQITLPIACCKHIHVGSDPPDPRLFPTLVGLWRTGSPVLVANLCSSRGVPRKHKYGHCQQNRNRNKRYTSSCSAMPEKPWGCDADLGAKFF